MNENIEDLIISEIAPVLIPTPYVGKYETTITLVNAMNNTRALLIGQENVVNLLNYDSVEEIKDFMLESIFNIQESMIIYNDIFISTDYNRLRAWSLITTIVKGNQKIKYIFASDNINVFSIYLKKYENMARRNGFVGMADELGKIKPDNDPQKVYKFKSSRKSLL